MKLLRTLFSVLFSLALVVGLLPSARMERSVLAGATSHLDARQILCVRPSEATTLRSIGYPKRLRVDPLERTRQDQRVVRMANDNPDYVLQWLNDILNNWQKFNFQVVLTIFYGVTKREDREVSLYTRSAALVYLSGATLRDIANTPSDPFDPRVPTGAANFLVSPWPKIDQATIQSDTVHVVFTTHELTTLHHPMVRMSNGADTIDKGSQYRR